jgi:Spy/CpxP family protein refolding chaperone
MQIMKTMRLSLAAALLAACCVSNFATARAEAPPADRGQASGQDPRGHSPDGGRHEFGSMRGHMGFPGHLQLSEAQQDKLFAIHHAAAPQHRQQEQAIRRARESLRAIANAAQFDEARANAAARELGQAIAAEALLRTRLHAQMLAVLSPEQRERLRTRRPQPPQGRP